MKKVLPIIGLLLLGIFVLVGYIYWKSIAKVEKIPEYVFTYAENQDEGYPTTMAAYRFSDLVYERTDGRIKINIHSEGALGDEVSVVEQMRYGGIDFARVSIMALGDYMPQMNILQLPYLYDDFEHMWAVLNGEIGDEFMSYLEGYGLEGLAWYDAGVRNIYTTQEITGLDDIKGKYIRVAKTELMASLISALGGIAVRMNYEEAYSALELGEIDGAENNWPSYESTDHYKVANYMLLDEHSRIPELQIVSQVTWNKLSKENQEIIKECAAEASIYQQELWKQGEKESKEKVERVGVIPIELSEEEKKRFREAVFTVYEKYGEGYEELIQRIKKAAP